MENKQTILVTSAFIPNKNKFLIAKRADDDDFFPGYWELAGGKAEFGEKLEEAVAREIKEEVGLDITAKHVLVVRDYLHESNPNKQFVEFFYFGEMFNPNQQVTLSHEHSDFSWISFADVPNYNISPYTINVIAEIKNHPLIQSLSFIA